MNPSRKRTAVYIVHQSPILAFGYTIENSAPFRFSPLLNTVVPFGAQQVSLVLKWPLLTIITESLLQATRLLGPLAESHQGYCSTRGRLRSHPAAYSPDSRTSPV